MKPVLALTLAPSLMNNLAPLGRSFMAAKCKGVANSITGNNKIAITGMDFMAEMFSVGSPSIYSVSCETGRLFAITFTQTG